MTALCCRHGLIHSILYLKVLQSVEANTETKRTQRGVEMFCPPPPEICSCPLPHAGIKTPHSKPNQRSDLAETSPQKNKTRLHFQYQGTDVVRCMAAQVLLPEQGRQERLPLASLGMGRKSNHRTAALQSEQTLLLFAFLSLDKYF